MSCIIQPPEPHFLRECAERLQAGELVAFPTETVYGLGADARNDKAVASIYAAKGRPSFNPLIVHLAHASDAEKYAVMTPLARKLAEAFWPGPCTLVLERIADCPLSLLISAGLDTVALRVPAHPVAHTLLELAGVPVAAPSANRSGRVSPTEAEHVAEEFKERPAGRSSLEPVSWDFQQKIPETNIMPILDGGACAIGLESTVVDARGGMPIILRPGSVTEEDIVRACGALARVEGGQGALHSPGMLASHYAPDRLVRLNVRSINEWEALLAFGPDAPAGEHVLNLSPSGDLVEAAANLFAYLRLLDREPYVGIAVMPIPEAGLGVAINDRLRRAATKK